MDNTNSIIHLPVQKENKPSIELISSSKSFIEANSIECDLSEIKQQHTIPVWLKDNEPLISHSDFIEAAYTITSDIYCDEHILKPNIRVSHPIKGRVPSAKDKPAHLLSDQERTLFYERMMFVIEVPSVQAEVGGNLLSLTIGGVKSYSEDNFYQRSGGSQHFKFFIGFKNTVCTNLCVWSDGYNANVEVKDFDELYIIMHSLVKRYNQGYHLHHLRSLNDYTLTEKQFAQIIGRIRMYNHLPNVMRNGIKEMLLTDTQVGLVVKDYYRDNSFCREGDGTINLWKLYNLLTGANKSSYIDSFLDRSVNAFDFVTDIRWAIENNSKEITNWYLC
ncbi:MAG: DUF3871 family protein [Bacteroidetes bacterium]|nr:DUF3871 family protein [Bacteroidota bacterium]